jgi:hypothetical protein
MSEISLPVAPGVVYKIIPGFPRYAAGSDGSIWSSCVLEYSHINRGWVREQAGKAWRRLKTPPNKKGYFQVNLRANGKTRHLLVHWVIAMTFIGPRPIGMEICHGDGNPANNSLSNLRYGTYQDNRMDMIRHGRTTVGKNGRLRGECHPHAKLSNADVVEIRLARQHGETLAIISKKFKVSKSTVDIICRGRSWVHVQ